MSESPTKKAAAKPVAPPREMTYLESDDEIRQALQARRKAALELRAKAQQGGRRSRWRSPSNPNRNSSGPRSGHPRACSASSTTARAKANGSASAPTAP